MRKLTVQKSSLRTRGNYRPGNNSLEPFDGRRNKGKIRAYALKRYARARKKCAHARTDSTRIHERRKNLKKILKKWLQILDTSIKICYNKGTKLREVTPQRSIL